MKTESSHRSTVVDVTDFTVGSWPRASIGPNRTGTSFVYFPLKICHQCTCPSAIALSGICLKFLGPNKLQSFWMLNLSWYKAGQSRTTFRKVNSELLFLRWTVKFDMSHFYIMKHLLGWTCLCFAVQTWRAWKLFLSETIIPEDAAVPRSTIVAGKVFFFPISDSSNVHMSVILAHWSWAWAK